MSSSQPYWSCHSPVGNPLYCYHGGQNTHDGKHTHIQLLLIYSLSLYSHSYSAHIDLYTLTALLQLWIYTIPAGVTFILTLVAFWWKEPSIPPAPSGDRDHIPPFFKGVLLVRIRLNYITQGLTRVY